MLQFKLLILAAILIIIAGLTAAVYYQKSEKVAAQSEALMAKAETAVAKEVIQQKEQNMTAVKAIEPKKKKDMRQLAPIEARINQLPEGYFNAEDSQVVLDLIYHFNCAGVRPHDSCDGEAGGSVLPPTDEAGLVSIGSAIDAFKTVIEYAHDLERTDECYTESQQSVDGN